MVGHALACGGVAGFMAAIWGGVAYAVRPDMALPIAIGLFMFFFAVMMRTRE